MAVYITHHTLARESFFARLQYVRCDGYMSHVHGHAELLPLARHKLVPITSAVMSANLHYNQPIKKTCYHTCLHPEKIYHSALYEQHAQECSPAAVTVTLSVLHKPKPNNDIDDSTDLGLRSF